MSVAATRPDLRSLGTVLAAVLLAVAAGAMVAYTPVKIPLALVGAVAVAALAFLRTEWVLHLLILSMLLSPEFAVGGSAGGAGLEGSRGAVIRLEDMLLVVIGVAWLAKMAVHKQLGLILRNPLNTPILLYCAVAAISTVLGIGEGRVSPATGALFTLKYFEYFVVFYVALNHIRDRKAARRVVITALVTAVLVSLAALAQIPSGKRVSAPFEGEVGEPNTLGGYLVLMMAITGAMALEAPTPRARFLLGGAVGLMGIPLLYTLSRSSWMAAVGAILLLLVLTRRRGRLAAVVLLGGIVVLGFLPGQVSERIEYTFTSHRDSVEVGDVQLDPSASARLRSWGETLEDTLEHPFLGYGITGYHFIDAQYFRILAETGLFGFAAFFFLILVLARYALRAAHQVEDPYLRAMCAGFVAALAGLLVHAIGANTFIIVRIMEPFWLFAALVILAPTLDAAKRSEVADHARP